MEKAFHQIIPLLVLEAMPELRSFFEAQGYAEHLIREDTIRPDTVYHDSLMQSAEMHHAHSIKLYQDEKGHIRWKDGDCIDSIKAYSMMIVRLYVHKDFNLVCRFLGELSHYVVDGMTYPHLVRGKPWSEYHMPFEIAMARWIAAHKDEIGELEFTAQKSVYRAALSRAIRLWPTANAVVSLLEHEEDMTDDEKLAYCRAIAHAVGSTWLTIVSGLFPSE